MTLLWPVLFGFLLVAGSVIDESTACCGEDCPKEERCPDRCEDHSGRCVDKSEHCAEFAKFCENFFFRRCVRCACPKTCGICRRHHHSSSSSSEEKTTSTTTSTTTTTTTPSTTTTTTTSTQPPSTTTTTTLAPTTPIEVAFDLAVAVSLEDDPPSSSSTTEEPSEEVRVDVAAVAAEFKDQKKVYCKPCEVRRKELKAIFDTYYPVSATTKLHSMDSSSSESSSISPSLSSSTIMPLDLGLLVSSSNTDAPLVASLASLVSKSQSKQSKSAIESSE